MGIYWTTKPGCYDSQERNIIYNFYSHEQPRFTVQDATLSKWQGKQEPTIACFVAHFSKKMKTNMSTDSVKCSNFSIFICMHKTQISALILGAKHNYCTLLCLEAYKLPLKSTVYYSIWWITFCWQCAWMQSPLCLMLLSGAHSVLLFLLPLTVSGWAGGGVPSNKTFISRETACPAPATTQALTPGALLKWATKI